MASPARTSLARRLRLALAGAAVLIALTVASAGASPPTPMEARRQRRPGLAPAPTRTLAPAAAPRVPAGPGPVHARHAATRAAAHRLPGPRPVRPQRPPPDRRLLRRRGRRRHPRVPAGPGPLHHDPCARGQEHPGPGDQQPQPDRRHRPPTRRPAQPATSRPVTDGPDGLPIWRSTDRAGWPGKRTIVTPQATPAIAAGRAQPHAACP
jgi:hypothetical protein